MSCVSPESRKIGKNIKRPRSPLLAPFRADQATAGSDIIVRVAADDLRRFTAAVAHQMSVYASSALLGRNTLRANRAASAPLFLWDLCSYHCGCTRELGACFDGED
jgi:hypothetical protein